MRLILRRIWSVFRRGDLGLLTLCRAASAFGGLIISSATAHNGSLRYVIIQMGAIAVGVISYVAVSAVDLDFIY